MIATGNNNISNIKVGNTQIKNIYLGTSGVWTNKTKIDYTVKNYIHFAGDVTQYESKLNGFNANLSKSITWNTDNYILKNTITESISPNKNTTYDNGYTIFEQINTFTDTIYKSDLNKYKYISSSFTYTNKNTSGVNNYYYYNLNAYNNPITIITNGELNNSITMNNANLNTELTLDSTGVPKFNQIVLYTTQPEFIYTSINGVYGAYVVINTTFKVTNGSVNINANTKYKLNDATLTLWGKDQTGIVFNGDDIETVYDDFINVYTYDGVNNTITLTQYLDYTGAFINNSGYDMYCEYYVKNYNLNGHVRVSLDGTFTENKMIGCIYNNFYIDGYNKTITSFTSYNTEPIRITATSYKTIFEYTLTDIYD